MTLSIGFSPCPNDTFIFDALVNNKLDNGGLNFEPVLDDVETLNRWAMEGRLDVTKLSYAVLPAILDKYILLNSGSALGTGVGPLLISKNVETTFDVENRPVAIPGEHTTAHLLFSIAFPNAKNKVFLRYDEIEEFVLQNKGLGVIIHENRFTYQQKGLHKIMDLGNYWEQETGNLIPLGGIVIKRGIELPVQQQVDRLISESTRYAFKNYPKLDDFVKFHSQEMSEDVMRRHIELYVNDYSVDLGATGKKAIIHFIELYNKIHANISSGNEIFVPINQSS